MTVTVTQGPPAWVQELDEEVTWTSEQHAEVNGWAVTLRWWGDVAGTVRGPRQIVITATDSLTPEEVRRGVSPSVLRYVAPVVADLSQRFSGNQDAAIYEKTLADNVAKLPKGGPRADPVGYYSGLLRLLDVIEATSPEPVADLARAMGLPKNTVKTQIRAARKRLNAAAQDGADT